MALMPQSWPAHRTESRPWQQTVRGGTRDDRVLRSIEVTIPPVIGGLSLQLDSAVAAAVESATIQIRDLDSAHGAHLESLGALLIRTESVASSKIEHIRAGMDDYARALHGSRRNPSAVAMVAATDALRTMIQTVHRTGQIDLSLILQAHRLLMIDDTAERTFAGALRTMQNWIGGSDHSPRNALFVPPPPDLVPGCLADLVQFMARDDLPALVQAALAHAQFESIHPFTDGNGRIGRALINAVLRRRRATSKVVAPIASALLSGREHYFDLLTSYRRGEITDLIGTFANAAAVAAAQSKVTAARLAVLPAQWREMAGQPRQGSAMTAVLASLPGHPIVTAEELIALTGSSRSSVFDAVSRLVEAGILRPLTDRKRDQVWAAADILAELDDLDHRIAAQMRWPA